jgi:hypothetical protein
MLPSGSKGRSKLEIKQNKYLTEEATHPYGRLQPTTSKKKEEMKKKQQNQQLQNNNEIPQGCSLQT